MSAAAGVLPPALAKEIRALLPTYAAALASIAIGCVSSSYLLIAMGLLGFAFGSVALGAQSFGLEYSHRTLGLLLSQPIDRRRVFFYKLAVLSVMLVTLTVAILVLYDDLLRRAASPHTEPSMLMLAAACGLFVAPTLTMICRSTWPASCSPSPFQGCCRLEPTWLERSATGWRIPPRSTASGFSSSGGAC